MQKYFQTEPQLVNVPQVDRGQLLPILGNQQGTTPNESHADEGQCHSKDEASIGKKHNYTCNVSIEKDYLFTLPVTSKVTQKYCIK